MKTLIAENLLMSILSMILSRYQTRKIIRSARKASWVTIIQTFLLGVFGLMVTSYMTSSLKKEIHK